MGVVSNGMLCSGDELNLTADADGILILPPDAPIGVRARRALRRRRPRRRRQAEPRRRAVARRARPRGRGGDRRRRSAGPTTDPPEAGATVDERLVASRSATPALVPAVRRPLGRRRRRSGRRRIASRCASGPPAMRPISNVVDASNYVMLELGKPIHTFDAAAVARARRPAPARSSGAPTPGERLETLDHVERTLDPETLLIADDRGAARDRRVMGGAASEVERRARRDVIVESAIFDPVIDPPDRPALRPPLRGEPPVREGPGVPARPARRRPDGAAHRGVGRRHGRPRPRRHGARRAGAGAGRVPAGRVNRLLGTDAPGGRAARAPRPRRHRDRSRRRRGRSRSPVAAGPKPLDGRRAGDEALVAIVPTWRRDIAIEADVAEEVARVRGYEPIPAILPDTPMPPFRAVAARGPRRDPRDARRRRPHRGRHPRARLAADRRARSAGRRRAAGGRRADAGGRPPDPRHEPAVGRPLGAPPVARRQPRRGRRRRTSATAATTSRSSRSARATADDVGDEPREWWRLGARADRRGRGAAAWNRPAAAVRPRRREGRDRARLPRASGSPRRRTRR